MIDKQTPIRGIQIIVPGKPIAQPRPRFFTRLAAGAQLWTAAKRAKSPQHLRRLLMPLVTARPMKDSDHAVHEYKRRIQSAARVAFPGLPWEGPVMLNLLFLMPRPKNKIWKTKPMPRYPHWVKPDEDNLKKGVKDALEGIAYKNDSQVCGTRCDKWVCAGDEKPKTIIRLSRIETRERKTDA